MSARQRSAMAALAAVCLWSLAFLFGVVTERMREGCHRGTSGTNEGLTTLVRDTEGRQ